MIDTSSNITAVQATALSTTAQTVNEKFARQASQISALSNTPPVAKTDSPRSINPTPVTKAYDHHGDIEREEEPTGEKVYFIA